MEKELGAGGILCVYVLYQRYSGAGLGIRKPSIKCILRHGNSWGAFRSITLSQHNTLTRLLWRKMGGDRGIDGATIPKQKAEER